MSRNPKHFSPYYTCPESAEGAKVDASGANVEGAVEGASASCEGTTSARGSVGGRASVV